MGSNYSSPTLANVIVWGNTPNQINTNIGTPNITYSDVQGGCPAGATCTQVICNLDPHYLCNPSPGADGVWGTADDDYGDLRLQLTSPPSTLGSMPPCYPVCTTTWVGIRALLKLRLCRIPVLDNPPSSISVRMKIHPM